MEPGEGALTSGTQIILQFPQIKQLIIKIAKYSQKYSMTIKSDAIKGNKDHTAINVDIVVKKKIIQFTFSTKFSETVNIIKIFETC